MQASYPCTKQRSPEVGARYAGVPQRHSLSNQSLLFKLRAGDRLLKPGSVNKVKLTFTLDGPAAVGQWEQRTHWPDISRMFRLIIVISKRKAEGAMLGRPACDAGSSRRIGPDGAAHLIEYLSPTRGASAARPLLCQCRSPHRSRRRHRTPHAARAAHRRPWRPARPVGSQRAMFARPIYVLTHVRHPAAAAADGRAKYSAAAFPLHYGMPPAELPRERAAADPLPVEA